MATIGSSTKTSSSSKSTSSSSNSSACSSSKNEVKKPPSTTKDTQTAQATDTRHNDQVKLSKEGQESSKSDTVQNLTRGLSDWAGHEEKAEATPGAKRERSATPQEGADAGESAPAEQAKLELGQGELLARYSNSNPEKVTQLQEMLKGQGVDLAVDGKFGPETQNAVRQYQQRNNLKVDGIVGPETLGVLNGSPSPSADSATSQAQTTAPDPAQTTEPNAPAEATPGEESPSTTDPAQIFSAAFEQGMNGSATDLGSKKTLAEARRNGQDLYFRAGGAIDTDGSGSSHGDVYHQNQTSLSTSDSGFVNADTTPYFVLPPDVMKGIGAKPGDLGLIRRDGKILPAVFADVGPSSKIGELSYTAAQQLGLNPNPNTGGTHNPEVEYLVFPGSGNRNPSGADLTQDALARRVMEYLQNR